MSSILVDDHKDTIINVRSNSMNLPLVEAIPDEPEEATQNADPDSCRMLLNPMVTVSTSQLKHEFLRRDKLDDDKDDEGTRKKRSRDRHGDEIDDKTHDLLDRMTRDVVTRDHVSHGSRTASPDRRSVASNRVDKLDDFNTFIQSATSAPPLVAPSEKLTPEARRRLKAELLQEYQKKNADYTFCPTVLTLEDSLDDIMDAVEFVRIKKSHESTKEWAKNTMSIASFGLVQAVNKFNLVGCDMTPWSEDFSYELKEQGKYDDMLDDIIRTYRSKITIPTEYKLVLAIGTSFAKGVFACRAQAKAEMERRERIETQRALKEAQESQKEQARNLEIMRQHLEQQKEQQQHMYQQMQQFSTQRQMTPPPQMTSPMQIPVDEPTFSVPPRGLFAGPNTSIQEMRALIADRMMDDESSIESIASAPREIPIEIPAEVHDEVTTTEPPPPQAVPPKRRGRKPKPRPSKENDETEMLTLSIG